MSILSGFGLSDDFANYSLTNYKQDDIHIAVKVDAGSTACEDMGCPPGRGCGTWGCSEDASTEVTFADACGDGIPQLGWIYTSRND